MQVLYGLVSLFKHSLLLKLEVNAQVFILLFKILMWDIITRWWVTCPFLLKRRIVMVRVWHYVVVPAVAILRLDCTDSISVFNVWFFVNNLITLINDFDLLFFHLKVLFLCHWLHIAFTMVGVSLNLVLLLGMERLLELVVLVLNLLREVWVTVLVGYWVDRDNRLLHNPQFSVDCLGTMYFFCYYDRVLFRYA